MLSTTKTVRLDDGSTFYGHDPEAAAIARAISTLRKYPEKITEEQQTEMQNILNGVEIDIANESKILWDKRNAFSARLKSFMQTADRQWEAGDKYKIIRWNRNNDIRIYIGYAGAEFGDNLMTYFATGNTSKQPKTLEAWKGITVSAELRQLVSDIAAEKNIGNWKTS